MKRKTEKNNCFSVGVSGIFGIIICIVLIPLLIGNCILVIKSYFYTDQLPDLGGYFPLIVLSDSMYPEIKSGDLIICHTEDPNQIEVGDTVAFFDPVSEKKSVVTHRVIEIINENGALSFRTKGDANDEADETIVPADYVVGTYRNRIAGIGTVVIFLQTMPGMMLCVVLPLFLLLIYENICRLRFEKKAVL